MIVPDANLLLYATHAESPYHAAAHSYLAHLLSGDEPVGLAWISVVAFVRISTHRRVFTSAISANDALTVVDGWFARRQVQTVDPGLGHWTIMRRLLRDVGTAGNLTNDAHLAALCIERGATLHSADTDFARFRGLRWENPLVSE